MNGYAALNTLELAGKTTEKSRSGIGRSYVYKPASLWSHLKFGFGALAAIVIPPLLPGATGQGLVMGYMSMLVAVYVIVCILGIARELHLQSNQRRK